MSGLQFIDLLKKAGIDPMDVNILLHSPKGYLGEVMPALVGKQLELLEAYQATHNRPAERALCGGRKFTAVFLKVRGQTSEGLTKLVFVGLYENNGAVKRTHEEIRAEPQMARLRSEFGVDAECDHFTPEQERLWFQFDLTERFEKLRGRLVIGARLTQSYVRLAENLEAPVVAINEMAIYEQTPPSWRDFVVSSAMVKNMPTSWADMLRRWRGIYLIVDEMDGERYVGAAYGEDNLLGRWRQHVAGERGITVGLETRYTDKFRFSILELLAPEAESKDVLICEAGWKRRLHTMEHGLNEN